MKHTLKLTQSPQTVYSELKKLVLKHGQDKNCEFKASLNYNSQRPCFKNKKYGETREGTGMIMKCSKKTPSFWGLHTATGDTAKGPVKSTDAAVQHCLLLDPR